MATLSPTLVKDTYLESNNGVTGNNYGADPKIEHRSNATTVRRRIVFDFGSISAIPAGSTINSAILTLNCTTVTTGGQNLSFHRMTNLTWTEGIGTTSVATGVADPGASWDNSDNENPTPWTTAGGDFDTTPSNSSLGSIEGLTDPTTTGSKTFDIKTVIAACLASGGQANFIMKREVEGSPTTGAVFDSKQGTTPPTLLITYTAPAGGSTTIVINRKLPRYPSLPNRGN